MILKLFHYYRIAIIQSVMLPNYVALVIWHNRDIEVWIDLLSLFKQGLPTVFDLVPTKFLLFGVLDEVLTNFLKKGLLFGISLLGDFVKERRVDISHNILQSPQRLL